MDLLTGIKVIDFTRLLPGPLATKILAQMGADIIKIESPQRVDYSRTMGNKVDDEATLFFYTLNHNKQQSTLDYNTDEGRDRMFELIREADVMVEQFRPGAMDSWGLGYDEVKAINPGIVYLSITGYGQSGKLAYEAGHDINYLAMSGLLSLLKDDDGKPVIPGFQLADVGGGSYMALIACLSALIKKNRTGEGSYIDISMTDALLPMMTIPLSMQYSGLDHRKFNFLNGKNSVNYAAYQCADDKWLAVGALELKFWNNLCKVIGKEEWKRDNVMALSSHIFPKNEIVDLFKTKTRDEWIHLCKDQDVCLSPVLEIEELENHPHHLSRENLGTFELDNGTRLNEILLPIKVSS